MGWLPKSGNSTVYLPPIPHSGVFALCRGLLIPITGIAIVHTTGMQVVYSFELELSYLPGYSPELNPDKYVWNHLKNNGLGRKSLTSAAELRSLIIGHLRTLQHLPRVLASFTLRRLVTLHISDIYLGNINNAPAAGENTSSPAGTPVRFELDGGFGG